MYPLVDALKESTLAAEVSMVISGADQVEIGGFAVEVTSISIRASTSEIDV